MHEGRRAMIWNEWHQTSGPRFPSEKFVQFLYRSYGREENSISASALDLGCGSGIHAEVLVRLGMSVTGVDVSQAAMEQCRQRFEAAGLPTPLLIRSLFSNLEFHSKSFDLIISTGALDYAGQLEARLVSSLLPNWLRPGGKAFLLFAADGDFRQDTVKHLDLHCYTRQEVDEMFCARDGLDVWIDQCITTFQNDSKRQIDWIVTLERPL